MWKIFLLSRGWASKTESVAPCASNKFKIRLVNSCRIYNILGNVYAEDLTFKICFSKNKISMKRTSTRKSTLKRDINPMPKNIRAALIGQGLLKLYIARPAYQRND